jgi:two-component system, NarL family, sensor histidine kinase DevS
MIGKLRRSGSGGFRSIPLAGSVGSTYGRGVESSGSLAGRTEWSAGQLAPDRTLLSQDELTRLLAVGRALVSELDLEAVLKQVLETARELTSARYAALGILDEDKRELERFVTIGVGDETRRTIGPPPRGHGVLGELIRDPKPLRLPDVTEHPRSYGFPPGHPPMTSFLGVPITVRGEAYGNLYLTDKSGGELFSESDEQLVVVLAEWAGVAIDNARLYETVTQRRAELERAVRGLEATSAISRAVGFETELDRVLELIVKRGRAMTEARSFIVLLQENDVLCVKAAAGEIGSGALEMEVPLHASVAGAAVSSGKPELIPDLRARVGHGLEGIATAAQSAAIVPLGFRGRAAGVLVALDRMRDGPAFDGEDEHLLTSFAASAAIAIATAQSVEAERLRHSMRASEDERARWARELHDETLQELGALKVILDAARQTQDAGRMTEGIESAVSQIELSIRNLQALITELRPAALDQIGLVPALEALVKRVAATSGMAVDSDIRLRQETTRLQPEIERTIYRVIQESFTNAIKHSEATSLRLELVEKGDALSLFVSDDGKGFDPQAISAGFGLVGMQERVALVDGAVKVESTPGAGTTVTADVPARHRDERLPEGPPAERELAG